MNVEVTKAIAQLERAFPSSVITVTEDGSGGAHVFVENLDLGVSFIPQFSWMGGHISALYPYSDIYPVFIDAAVHRVDGKNFEPPVTSGHNYGGRSAIQISRRNNQIQNGPQTAVAKFLKILDFMGNLP